MEYIPAKTIITKTKNAAWFGNDYTMNIYKGCCHGCIYCDSRSDCYGVEDFDRVRAKKDALQIIRDELRRKTRTGVIGTGAMSDPYNPFEEDLKLTRHALELINAFEFGVTIATKSTLLARDIDILKEIQEHSPILCKITITTVEDTLSRKIEPRVASSSKRFELLQELSEQGIPAGILMMPVLPFLEDSKENVLGIVEKAHEAGAKFIYPAFGMTLRQNQRIWYLNQLEELFPKEHLAQLYTEKYGNRYQCTSLKARQLWTYFKESCQNYGILYNMKDIIHFYKRNYEVTQMSLFE